MIGPIFVSRLVLWMFAVYLQHKEVLAATYEETCSTCECGRERRINVESRIVNGSPVEYKSQYPWMGQLWHNDSFLCGSILINPRYVLTAAHCAIFTANQYTVRFLTDRLNGSSNATLSRKIDRKIVNENYDPDTLDNDIALMRFDREVQLGNDVEQPAPICLPPPRKTFSGENGLVVGWGRLAYHGPLSNILREDTLPILSNNECKRTGYPAAAITTNMICAGFLNGGKGSCSGDSGGPLAVSIQSVYYVVGIVSWGKNCAEENYPDVFTRVNRYLRWIRNNTADTYYCRN